MDNSFEWIKHKNIAHRGYHNSKNDVPENSLKSISLAMDKNYAVEFDVRISKDNTLYVIHDKNLKRLCGVDKKFESLHDKEIESLRLLGTNEIVPSRAQVLTLVDCRQPLMIEIKPTTRYKKLMEQLIIQLSNYKGRFVLQSYSPIIISWLKKNHPHIIRGIITEGYGHSYQPIYPIWRLSQIKIWHKLASPDFYNFNIKDLPNKRMSAYYNSGIPILSFTARSQKDLDFVKTNYTNAVFELFEPKK